MANVDKCHILYSSVEDHTIEINGCTVKNSHCEKLLGSHFDDHLKSDFHIEKLCKNANRKLYSLARVTPYMNLSKKRILMNVRWFRCVTAENFIIKSTGYMKDAYA